MGKSNKKFKPSWLFDSLDTSTRFDEYGNKTEFQLVSDLLLKKDSGIDLSIIVKSVVATAKTRYSRNESGKYWYNKEGKQASIHEIVTQKMAQNDSILDAQWFDREVINSKWISINCATAMYIADEYIAVHKTELDEHNLRVRVVNGEDKGKYFNRSARSEKKKQAIFAPKLF